MAVAAGLVALSLILAVVSRHGLAQRLEQLIKSWDPDVELIALLRLAHLPHGSREEVELIVRKNSATARRTHRPRYYSPKEDIRQAEVAVPAHQITDLRNALEKLSAWELPDQKSSVRDGTRAKVGLADGSRSHAFSAHMPRGDHLVVIQRLLALAPMEGVEDRIRWKQ